jgi:hypothetical protein
MHCSADIIPKNKAHGTALFPPKGRAFEAKHAEFCRGLDSHSSVKIQDSMDVWE